MPVIDIPYTPRVFQREIGRLCRAKRFGVLVCHRRFGKTVLGVNINQQTATMCPKVRPRCAYIGPTYRQAKATAWDYMQYYARPVPGVAFNQSELRVDYPNLGQSRIYGADNPDALRGIYLDRAVLDEYGMHPAKTFSEVIGPTLVDRGGSALFLGTPNGKNQFYDIAKLAQAEEAKGNPDWFFREFKASVTGLLDEGYLASAKQVMTADEYAQEFECSFEASVKGAIYTKELERVRTDGRLTRVPYDPALPVDTDWDLGIGDAMAIWFSQSLKTGEVRLIDYVSASGEGFPYYVRILNAKGYTYGHHWAPHDIVVRELGTGKSRLETATSFGLRFSVTPRITGALGVEVEEGINAVRLFLGRCWFDADRCQAGYDALMNYRRDYNKTLNEFKAAPVHDWACVTGDTNVLTRSGMHQIQYLPNHGEVLTRCGWKAYENPRITRRNAPLVAVTFDDGLTVRCTPEHRFLTDSGWTFAADLTPGSRIQSSLTHSPSISMAPSIASGRRSGISPAAAVAFIGTCGRRLLDQFRGGVTSIIEMATRVTTPSRIWNVFPRLSTYPQHGGSMPLAAACTSPRRLARPPRLGTPQRPVAPGIVATRSEVRAGRNGNASPSRASIVASLFRRWCARVTRRSFVLKPARPLRIACVTPLDERSDVWCLTVPDGHMWSLENGAITHNSHGADAFRGLAVRHRTPHDEPAVPAYVPPSVWG